MSKMIFGVFTILKIYNKVFEPLDTFFQNLNITLMNYKIAICEWQSFMLIFANQEQDTVQLPNAVVR